MRNLLSWLDGVVGHFTTQFHTFGNANNAPSSAVIYLNGEVTKMHMVVQIAPAHKGCVPPSGFLN
jgi:hypothetical protein